MQAQAQNVAERSLGAGPYERLVIRGAIMIDGAGAPPVGPVDIVVEDGRIAAIAPVGAPGLPINENARPAAGVREISAEGKYVLPGFVSLHAHIHDEMTGQGVSPDYIFRLWLAHGITTVRDLGNQWRRRMDSGPGAALCAKRDRRAEYLSVSRSFAVGAPVKSIRRRRRERAFAS